MSLRCVFIYLSRSGFSSVAAEFSFAGPSRGRSGEMLLRPGPELHHRDGRWVNTLKHICRKSRCLSAVFPVVLTGWLAVCCLDGELYSGTAYNFLGSEPIISRSSLSQSLLRTEYSTSWLNGTTLMSPLQYKTTQCTHEYISMQREQFDVDTVILKVHPDHLIKQKQHQNHQHYEFSYCYWKPKLLKKMC